MAREGRSGAVSEISEVITRLPTCPAHGREIPIDDLCPECAEEANLKTVLAAVEFGFDDIAYTFTIRLVRLTRARNN